MPDTLPGRVDVRRRPDPLYPDRPWLAQVVKGGDARPVAREATQVEAITTGVTAARFLAAGVPWRAEL